MTDHKCFDHLTLRPQHVGAVQSVCECRKARYTNESNEEADHERQQVGESAGNGECAGEEDQEQEEERDCGVADASDEEDPDALTVCSCVHGWVTVIIIVRDEVCRNAQCDYIIEQDIEASSIEATCEAGRDSRRETKWSRCWR